MNIRAIHPFGPKPGEYVCGQAMLADQSHIRATFDRVRRQIELAAGQAETLHPSLEHRRDADVRR